MNFALRVDSLFRSPKSSFYLGKKSKLTESTSPLIRMPFIALVSTLSTSTEKSSVSFSSTMETVKPSAAKIWSSSQMTS